MTPEQIREVVKIVIDELTRRKLLNTDCYQSALKVVGVRLFDYFNGAEDKALSYILKQLSDDPYIDVIYAQYRDGRTMEWIAEYMERDESTIKRNKKRLIMHIYDYLLETS